MTVNADTQSDARLSAKMSDLLAPVRQRPVLAAVSAVLFFIAAVAVSSWFEQPEQIKSVVDVVRLDLDRDAENPTSLLRKTLLAVDTERTDIQTDRRIGSALDKMFLGIGTVLPLPSRTASKSGEHTVGVSSLTNAVLLGLQVDAGPKTSELVISLSSDIAESTDQAVDIVDKIAAGYADLRNRERKQLKEQVLGWADGKLAFWQDEIDALSREQDTEPFNNAVSASQTDGTKLLAMIMDATRSAQADTLSKIRHIVSTGDGQQRGQSLDALEFDYTRLVQDLERLERLSVRAEPTPDRQQTEPPRLKEAEKELALFKKDLDALISSGVLDSPAAKIVATASRTSLTAPLRWAVIAPLAAASSIMLAIILASVVARLQSADGARTTTTDRADADVLTDPHWPMTPQQREQTGI